MKTRTLRPHASTSLRSTRWNEERGTWVSVYDGEIEGLDTEAGRWVVMCEHHGSLLNCTTLAEARRETTYDPAEWCSQCRSIDKTEATS